MAYFNKSFERARKAQMTHDKIIQIAKAKGSFSVSLRYRDDWLRARCAKLRSHGQLVGGRRDGDTLVFYPARAAIAQAQGKVEAMSERYTDQDERNDNSGRVYQLPRASKKLKVHGISRDAGDDRAVCIFFNRRLTDEELRFFHECSERTAALMPETDNA